MAANNYTIKPEAFEHGNVRPACLEGAIRILARQGILYQLAMAYVLRVYCASHNGEQFTCNTIQVFGVANIGYVLNITNQFGEYLDDIVIAFL